MSNIYPYKIQSKEHHQFCVYLTIYKGHKMPPFYIGSSSVSKVREGYRGSVSSKKWKTIFREELKNNPSLFDTHILITTSTRRFAMKIERHLHIINDVIISPFFINEAINTKNGMFGRDVSGVLHPLFGRARPSIERERISKNHADVRGLKNPKAKLIIIYDQFQRLQYVSIGKFIGLLKAKGLPRNGFITSYQKKRRYLEDAVKRAPNVLETSEFKRYYLWSVVDYGPLRNIKWREYK